jgi:hypothetical protein
MNIREERPVDTERIRAVNLAGFERVQKRISSTPCVATPHRSFPSLLRKTRTSLGTSCSRRRRS